MSDATAHQEKNFENYNIRYKKAFDVFVEANPRYSYLALIAFSGKLTGKDVMHASDANLGVDAFAVSDDEEFSESNMNPDVPSSDLRKAFERPEYRFMLVADKFQTGFDQPRLVAMYVDKKIDNDVEIVQTLSRLNRCAPGKDMTYVIDFVNDPENIRRAFAEYDDGAVIEDIQDPNVIYDIRGKLDSYDLYKTADLDAFKTARFRSLRMLANSGEPQASDRQHRALFAATENPARLYNERLKILREAVAKWEDGFQKAQDAGNEERAEQADEQRQEHEARLKQQLEFKSGLGRFCKTYAYIAQLLDLGDPDLENFAAFAKLLQNRLDGVPREDVDLQGLVLSGYDIRKRDERSYSAQEPPALEPIGPGAEEESGCARVSAS
jgi:type I restriction enzyme R subunit